jgi:hypothetical protein
MVSISLLIVLRSQYPIHCLGRDLEGGRLEASPAQKDWIDVRIASSSFFHWKERWNKAIINPSCFTSLTPSLWSTCCSSSRFLPWPISFHQRHETRSQSFRSSSSCWFARVPFVSCVTSTSRLIISHRLNNPKKESFACS